jgi:hypothetical protein
MKVFEPNASGFLKEDNILFISNLKYINISNSL